MERAGTTLQSSAPRLFPFDGFKKGLEVAFAETLGTAALDDFEKQRRAILHRLREDLQEIPFVIAIDQDAQLGQFPCVLLDNANAGRERFVIRFRYAQK